MIREFTQDSSASCWEAGGGHLHLIKLSPTALELRIFPPVKESK
jgi:hypothetical protein